MDSFCSRICRSELLSLELGTSPLSSLVLCILSVSLSLHSVDTHADDLTQALKLISSFDETRFSKPSTPSSSTPCRST